MRSSHSASGVLNAVEQSGEGRLWFHTEFPNFFVCLQKTFDIFEMFIELSSCFSSNPVFEIKKKTLGWNETATELESTFH